MALSNEGHFLLVREYAACVSADSRELAESFENSWTAAPRDLEWTAAAQSAVIDRLSRTQMPHQFPALELLGGIMIAVTNSRRE
jgi:hypothetical protein